MVYVQAISFQFNSTIVSINQPTYTDDTVIHEIFDVTERFIKFRINFESGVGSFLNFSFMGEKSGHNLTIQREFQLVLCFYWKVHLFFLEHSKAIVSKFYENYVIELERLMFVLNAM